MTAEQLEELLGKVTQGDWRVAGKASGYIFSDHESVLVAVAGNYRDRELLPYNKERWDSDAKLISLAPSLARRVIAAEKLVEALEQCLGEMTGNMDGDLREDRDGRDMAREALTAYREASK